MPVHVLKNETYGLQTRPRTCLLWDEKTSLAENCCFHEKKEILHFYPFHRKSKFSLSKKVVLFSFSLFYFICYFTRGDLNYFYSMKKKKRRKKKKRINPNAKSEKRQKSDSAYWLVSAGSLNHRKRRALGDEIEFGRLLSLEELGVYMGSFFCEEEQGIW